MKSSVGSQDQPSPEGEIGKRNKDQHALRAEIVNEDPRRQSTLEKEIAKLKKDLKAIIEKNRQQREQARLDSLKRTKQIERMSEMHDQIRDLEEQLSSRIEGIKTLRAQLSDSQDQLRESMEIVAEEHRRTLKKKELLDSMSTSPARQPTPSSRRWAFWDKVPLRREVFHGGLDMPVEDFNTSLFLEVSGWAYSTEAPISHVGAFLDNVPLGLMKYGEQHLELPSDSSPFVPTECGFSGRFPLDEFPVGRRTLLVRVIDERRNVKDFFRTIVIEEPAACILSAEVGVSVDPDGKSSLIAFPGRVPVGRILGLTELTWDTGDGSEAELRVSMNGEPEMLFASGPYGSKHATWILAGSTYEFRLYAASEDDRLLNEVSVTGTKISMSESRDNLTRFLALAASKNAVESLAQISLQSFLASNSIIEIPANEKPEISIVLVLYNRAELTLQCLYSILSDLGSYEVVIIDNGSTDATPRLLKKIKGAQIVQNETNLHFLRACNQAAKIAKGKYILLLNNDAQLMVGSVSSALRTLSSSSDIGAVGGKIILPDGTLQEAGSIIWQDGSCLGYGRGDFPFAPQYMYKRDVDYCSGAFLLTYRELFLEGGGFDEDYSPAYYEETDYCVRLWKQGKRVVYDPKVVLFHYEFASSSSQRSAIELQIEHRGIFASKHRDWLQPQQAPSTENILAARSHRRDGQRRILFIDDRVPHKTLGSGFPRSNLILTELVDQGHAVTFYPTTCPREDWSEAYQDIPPEVEVMLDYGSEKLAEFLDQRSNYYDVILISRPHNMASFKSMLAKHPGIYGEARIIYDAEALFCNRIIGQMHLEGQELSMVERTQLINDEISLAENCDSVVSVSEKESGEFAQYGCQSVYTLGHAVDVTPGENDFDQRRDVLFVGAIHSVTSPNADSMIWFSEQVFPLIQERLGKDVRLLIAGMSCPEFQTRVDNGLVQLLGKVDDLAPLYNQARIFVAPTRFSAGIPLKVCEAAAHGLPTVATSLTGLQLGWNDERELLLADDPQSFADACIKLYSDRALWNQLRDNMIKRVSQDFSREGFSDQLRLIIE